MDAALVEHVVADAGAFLKRAPLQEIGQNIYTLKDVVNEIRDKPTRRSLAVLPYSLNYKDPFPEHVRFVTEFSKKTGDYPSLSATDIKVLALTYQLELEKVGSNHLKSEPDVKIKLCSTQRHPEAPDNIAGFHFPHKNISDTPETPTPTPTVDNNVTSCLSDTVEFNSFQFWRAPVPGLDADLLELLGTDSVTAGEGYVPEPSQPSEENNTSTDSGKGKESDEVSADSQGESEEEEEGGSSEDGDDEDDGGGWITPNNIKQVKLDAGHGKPTADVKVGCVTTDFAMQNVLIQMGLNVLSLNGMLIKNTRNYILRCYACFKTTTNMNKSFCANCGNNTLKKVAVTIKEDGSMQMHFSRNPKVLNPKGLRYSLPKPQGGKHGNNPQLVEDQPFPQQRVSRKARQKTDIFDPDYLAGNSPFTENDIYSRSANLNIRDPQRMAGGGYRRSNPNAARKKFVKKK
ncbi:RNA-binding protein NOB1 isoform X3 [Engraulis encrasicolus]|uniref:RNA-binding protein NOB1 isoform X3 n=1 Tax=Engraulis encrasicolus TaxID=184585 RepID=UPI002FD2EC65